MKRVHLVVGLVVTLLMTKPAKALDEYITWTVLESPYAKGYLPRVAIDQAYGVVSVFEAGTGFDTLLYETGNNQKGLTPTGLAWTLWNPDSTINGGIGHAAAVALANGYGLYGTAIEVHRGGQDGGGALWYSTATAKLSKTYQIPAVLHWDSAIQFDTGFNPTVAVDNSAYPITNPGVELVAEIHQAASSASDLWYHIGWLEAPSTPSPTFVWGPAYKFDWGSAPSVGISGGLVVEAHQGSGGELWYRLGTAAFFEITWGPAFKYDTGYNPSVSIVGSTSSGGWSIVEAHQAKSGTGPLLYRTGTVKRFSDTQITWTPNADTQYAQKGCYPSIAQSGAYIVEVHETECSAASSLVYSFGYFYWI